MFGNMAGQRFLQGEHTQTPFYRYDEHNLGYETDMIFLGTGRGLPADNVVMSPVPNSRKTNAIVNQFIKAQWAEEQQKYNAFDSPRARYEGSMFDTDTDRLITFWSEEKYSTHAAIRQANVGKAYQANLWTINAILMPKNKKLPIGVRNATNTDQGRIKHLTPVGFVDLVPTKSEVAYGEVIGETFGVESIGNAVTRRLYAEWEVPERAFDPKRMELLGIVYNHHKNFDYDAAVLVPLDCDSHQLKSKQLRNGGTAGKYDAIEEVDMDESSLRALLFEFALTPDNSSGHMRGDIALTIGRLYGGMPKYKEVLEDTVMELAKLR